MSSATTALPRWHERRRYDLSRRSRPAEEPCEGIADCPVDRDCRRETRRVFAHASRRVEHRRIYAVRETYPRGIFSIPNCRLPPGREPCEGAGLHFTAGRVGDRNLAAARPRHFEVQDALPEVCRVFRVERRMRRHQVRCREGRPREVCGQYVVDAAEYRDRRFFFDIAERADDDGVLSLAELDPRRVICFSVNFQLRAFRRPGDRKYARYRHEVPNKASFSCRA